MPEFSLAQLTLLDHNPPALLDMAARTGYDTVSLRLLPAAPGGIAYPLMDDAALLRETLARVREGAVRVFDVEMIRIGEGFDPAAYSAFLDVAAQLGAGSILIAGDDPDRARLADNYARLCAHMAGFGLKADLEFMPWVPVATLGDAIDVVRRAGWPANGGILVDGLHFDRSDSRLEQLTEVPAHYFHYAQLCDARRHPPYSSEELIFTARQERLLPGEGEIDLVTLFSRLPKGLPVGVEIPSETRLAQLGAEGWARAALAAAKDLIARAEALRRD